MNLANLDKSMNFGMDTYLGLMIIFGYGAPRISPPGGRWRHLYELSVTDQENYHFLLFHAFGLMLLAVLCIRK